ncbi:MAG: hypothetical protein ACRCX2_31645 [Paraclostridium sp.]
MMEALLSKDPIVTCLYRRKTDGKFLVCKSKYNKKIGLPIVKILVSNYSIQHGKATSKDVSVQVVNAFRKEFGLDPEILNYYEGTKTSFVNNGVILNGNNIAFDMTDAGEYKGKPTITQNPSGDYTEVQWMSYNQILELVKTNLFDSSSLYYVLRSREQHRIKPILDSRLSLRVYADKTGLKIYNDPADPMPIKTTNMAGLQKWEETEDYIIYLCKDATMTTVQNYVTGTFQTFQERISDIESSQELMKSYSIEWTEQDSINLINEINNEALVKLEQSVMMLPVDGENEVQPIILEPKTVPTTYECCFRVDKKEKNFYIGEGYENFADKKPLNQTGLTSTIDYLSDGWARVTYTESGNTSSNRVYLSKLKQPISDEVGVYFKANFRNVNGGFSVFGGDFNGNRLSFSKDGIVVGNLTNTQKPDAGFATFIFSNSVQQSFEIELDKLIITKTSTPKPFVKSVMPSGKLAFVTGATSETHSFLGKSFNFLKSTDFKGTFLRGVRHGQNGRNEYIKPNKESDVDILVTKNLCKSFDKNIWSLGVIGDSGISTGVRYIASGSYNYDAKSFTQLLIYKANLTETELKAENGKLDFIQFEL